MRLSMISVLYQEYSSSHSKSHFKCTSLHWDAVFKEGRRRRQGVVCEYVCVCLLENRGVQCAKVTCSSSTLNEEYRQPVGLP